MKPSPGAGMRGRSRVKRYPERHCFALCADTDSACSGLVQATLANRSHEHRRELPAPAACLVRRPASDGSRSTCCFLRYRFQNIRVAWICYRHHHNSKIAPASCTELYRAGWIAVYLRLGQHRIVIEGALSQARTVTRDDNKLTLTLAKAL